MIEEALSTGIRQAWPFFVLLIVGTVVVAFLTFYRGPSRKLPVTYPYARRTGLFSQAEARFLDALRQAVPEFDVFGKVRLEDVITVKRGLSQSERKAARNRIKPRHLDFVLTDPASSWIVCVVELDDSTHQSARALRADDFKDQALATAGVPILRVRASSSYGVHDLQRRVLEVADFPVHKDKLVLSKPGPFEMPGEM